MLAMYKNMIGSPEKCKGLVAGRALEFLMRDNILDFIKYFSDNQTAEYCSEEFPTTKDSWVKFRKKVTGLRRARTKMSRRRVNTPWEELR